LQNAINSIPFYQITRLIHAVLGLVAPVYQKSQQNNRQQSSGTELTDPNTRYNGMHKDLRGVWANTSERTYHDPQMGRVQ